MKYLLIEDLDAKADEISAYLRSIDDAAQIDRVDNLGEARHRLLVNEYELIIFDIYLPLTKGESEQDVSSEILADFARSRNYHAEAIAVTKYSDRGLQRSRLFNDNGVTVVEFSESDGQWRESLLQKVRKIQSSRRLDFIVFCALTKERSAYQNTEADLGEHMQIGGLNCQELSVGNYQGMCITPSRMGLVNMAIACTKAIELFRPKIVAMSGICAGVLGESKYLDIVVGQVCWEYQTGKFKDGKFKQEPYQVPMKSLFKTELEQLAEQPAFVTGLKQGLFDTELKESGVHVAPISSGSVVIADSARMTEIGEQHRKWAALEMEMYSLYEAASQSVVEPLFFGAKAVVDMGDQGKADALHATACTLSARFVVEVLKRKLPQLVRG
ncbi:MAG: hypothetical protein K5880_02305 [Hydrogenophaga sp.]|uniref:phosphorylase family protein n=1 Tax=Hydrogenophaga sp. TaxID=1904254 RepID=UPI002610A6A8|nr:hypothetical protein [Hydrogenophaga sp.]MCV0437436.1 hypothetical protein [Hydrogenophaga sp.]